jgi:hypothetical protein
VFSRIKFNDNKTFVVAKIELDDAKSIVFSSRSGFSKNDSDLKTFLDLKKLRNTI